MKIRIKIYQRLGYRGYFWEVQQYMSHWQNVSDKWIGIGRGGYTWTFKGAERMARRAMARRQAFKGQTREWIIE